MNSREVVYRTITFQGADRLPYDLPEKYGSDFITTGMSPSPDDRPRQGVDEWGAVWSNLGKTQLGEVKDFPLKSWTDFEKMHIPDINDPLRWKPIEGIRQRAGDKFILGNGLSIYERVHFLRGLQNTWMDIFDAPQQLEKLLDLLVEMNLVAIRHYAEAGVDGYIFCDDWGLQNKLMISPKAWCAYWKSRYARIFKAAHDAGMLTFLHSCGYIVDILEGLIEAGLDVIHMDQQQNMGLELLGKRFGGRLTFFSPVDIQNCMVYGTPDEIRAYCQEMVRQLGRPMGGFIPRWYTDPAGAGHRQEAIDIMCVEFIRLSHAHKETTQLTTG